MASQPLCRGSRQKEALTWPGHSVPVGDHSDSKYSSVWRLASKDLCGYNLKATRFNGYSGAAYVKPELGLCLQVLASKSKLTTNLEKGFLERAFLV